MLVGDHRSTNVMLSFPKTGPAPAETTGYAFVFDSGSGDSGSGDSYAFLQKLAEGSQCKVQLVANLATNQIVVQKVSKESLPFQDGHKPTTDFPEDQEIRTLQHLNSFARTDPCHPLVSLTPRWTTCLSYDTVPTTTPGPHGPIPEYTRVSYWQFCNGGTVADWYHTWGRTATRDSDSGPRFPVSFIARCIAQVCETLHVMYQVGPEAVYHCDLHLANIFVHFDDDDAGPLPNFYIGDFGWARTGTEARADGVRLYGDSGGSSSRSLSPGGGVPLPAPGTAPPTQRRRWDVERLFSALQGLRRLALPPSKSNPLILPGPSGLSEQEAGLQRLMMMMEWMDFQDGLLAVRNPGSRPPSLLELVREAKMLEGVALAAEQGTEVFKELVEMGRSWAEKIKGEKPLVFITPGREGQLSETARQSAEEFGRTKVAGPWRLMETKEYCESQLLGFGN